MLAKFRKSEKIAFYLFQLAQFFAKILVVVLMNQLNLANEVLNAYETLFLTQNTFSFAFLNAFFNAFLQSRSANISPKNALAFLAGLVLAIDLLTFFPLWKAFPEETFPFLLFVTALNLVIFLPYYFFLQRKISLLFLFAPTFFLGFIGSLIVPLYFNFSLKQAFVAAGSFFAGIFLFFTFKEKLLPEFHKEKMLRLGGLLLPLAVTYFISGGANYLDSWIVKFFGTPEDFLRFRYGAREFPFTLMLANVISSSIVINLSEDRNLEYVRKNQIRFMHFAFPVTMLMLFLSKPVFSFLYKEEIASAYEVFNIFLLLVIPRALFPQSVLLAFHRNKRLMLASVPEFLLHILLGISGFFVLGIEGVAYGVFLAYLFEKLFLLYWVKRDLGFRPSEIIALKTYFFYVSLLIIVFVFVLRIY